MIPMIPDTPSSVLQLLNADKTALDFFANSIIQDVKQGNSNPLEIAMLVKKYEYVLDQIKENIKVNVNTEAVKYGEKPFMYGGSEVHYTPTRTEYDFSKCGDALWNDCDHWADKWTLARKERETFLKTLQAPMKILNEDTGELETVSPPIKKQSYGIKITIK